MSTTYYTAKYDGENYFMATGPALATTSKIEALTDKQRQQVNLLNAAWGGATTVYRSDGEQIMFMPPIGCRQEFCDGTLKYWLDVAYKPEAVAGEEHAQGI